MDAPEINYEVDDYSDVLKRDDRYDARAYDFVLRVISEATTEAKGHVTGPELLDYFRAFTIDAFGPLAYHVLTTWGLNSCEDVGAVVFNLYKSHRIGKLDSDSPADFIGGYNFFDEFLAPYQV